MPVVGVDEGNLLHGAPALSAPLAGHLIGEHGENDDNAGRDILPEGRHVEQRQAIPRAAKGYGADQRSKRISLAAKQAGAADHRRANRLKLQANAADRLRGADAGDQEEPGKGR